MNEFHAGRDDNPSELYEALARVTRLQSRESALWACLDGMWVPSCADWPEQDKMLDAIKARNLPALCAALGVSEEVEDE